MGFAQVISGLHSQCKLIVTQQAIYTCMYLLNCILKKFFENWSYHESISYKANAHANKLKPKTQSLLLWHKTNKILWIELM